MAQGSLSRRCSCRDTTGHQLGSNCPQRRRRDHGVWGYRIELAPDTNGARRPRRRSGFDTRDAAQAELDHVRALLALPERGDAHTATIVSDLIEKALTDKTALPALEEVRRRIHSGIGAADMPTVADWLHTWLPTQRHLAANTLRSYESHIRLYLTPTIGHHRIDRLRVTHLADMIETIDEFNDHIAEYRTSSDPALRALARYRRPVGPTSLHRIRATLRAALNDAMRQQLIVLNPAGLLKLPPPGKAKPVVWSDEHVDYWRRTGTTPSPVMVWTPQQTGRFLDHATHDRLYALYHLIAVTGLRRGEACGLHWHDLNLTAGTLTVRHQILQLGWHTELAPPKTDGSAATIAIPDEAISSLTATACSNKQKQPSPTPTGTTPDSPSPNPTDKPCTPRTSPPTSGTCNTKQTCHPSASTTSATEPPPSPSPQAST
jgi:integrase